MSKISSCCRTAGNATPGFTCFRNCCFPPSNGHGDGSSPSEGGPAFFQNALFAGRKKYRTGDRTSTAVDRPRPRRRDRARIWNRSRPCILNIALDYSRAQPISPPDFRSSSSRSESCCFSFSISCFFCSILAFLSLTSLRVFCSIKAFCGSL